MTTAQLIQHIYKVRNIGFKVYDEWLGTLLLAGLHEQYKLMIKAIESSDVATIADLVKTKLLQEFRLSDPGVFYIKSKQKQSEKQNVYKGLRCYSCNKYGNIIKNCKNKTNKKRCDSSFNFVFLSCVKQLWLQVVCGIWCVNAHEWPPSNKNVRVVNNKQLKVECCGEVNINVLQKDEYMITQVKYIF